MPLSGAVLLSGGRARNRNTSDVIVWLNRAGDGVDWVKYSVTYQHNRGVASSGSGLPTFPSDVNKSTANVWGSCGWTSSYTSLLPLQETTDSVVIVYDRAPQIIAPSGRCVANCSAGQEMYSMKMTLKTDEISHWLAMPILPTHVCPRCGGALESQRVGNCANQTSLLRYDLRPADCSVLATARGFLRVVRIQTNKFISNDHTGRWACNYMHPTRTPTALSYRTLRSTILHSILFYILLLHCATV
jgi:hypothetical protein